MFTDVGSTSGRLNTRSATTAPLVLPDGVREDDLILVAYVSDSPQNPTLGAWTPLERDSDQKIITGVGIDTLNWGVLYRIAPASPPGSYTLDLLGPAKLAWTVQVWRGVKIAFVGTEPVRYRDIWDRTYDPVEQTIGAAGAYTTITDDVMVCTFVAGGTADDGATDTVWSSSNMTRDATNTTTHATQDNVTYGLFHHYLPDAGTSFTPAASHTSDFQLPRSGPAWTTFGLKMAPVTTSGTYRFAGTPTGVKAPLGTASGGFAWTPSGSGAQPRYGSADGGFDFAVSMLPPALVRGDTVVMASPALPVGSVVRSNSRIRFVGDLL